MGYRGFSVCLVSLHLPEIPGDTSNASALGEESLRLIRGLYRFVHEKLVSAVNSYRTAELLDHSIFCCCVPEGMLMLHCSTDPVERQTALDGFLITKETLRTAWQLSRWKLLFVCAAGWDRYGTVWLTVQEIEHIAMSLKPSPALQGKLMDASRKMLASPAPFSFAVTSYPLYEIPVHFPGLAREPLPEAGTEQGEIVLSAEQAEALAERYRNEISVLKTMRLFCGSKKQYQQLRIRNAAPFEERSMLQKQLKDELQQYPEEEIWYFTVQVRQDLQYVRALRAVPSARLCAGSIDFSELCTEMESFIDDTYRWIGQMKQQEQAPPEAKEQTSAEERPGGFLRSLFRK
jgi:hypothetical protein